MVGACGLAVDGRRASGETDVSGPYTLEQVTFAGVFAFQLDGGDEVPIYNPYTNELAEIVPWEGVENFGSHSYADEADEWYHLPGCPCVLCAKP